MEKENDKKTEEFLGIFGKAAEKLDVKYSYDTARKL